MDIVYALVSGLLYVILCGAFADIITGNRSERVRFAPLIVPFWTCLTVTVTSFLSEQALIKMLLLVIISTAVLSYRYKGLSARLIFAVLMYHATGILCDLVTWIAIISIDPGIDLELMNNDMITVMAGLAGYLTQFIIMLITARILSRSRGGELSRTEWLRVAVFPTVTLVIMTATVYGTYRQINPVTAQTMYLVAASSLFMDLYAYHIMIYTTAKERQIREAHIRLTDAEKTVRLYSKLADELKIRSRQTHEYRNRLNIIKSCIASSRYDTLAGFVDEFSNDISIGEGPVRTGNIAADIILNSRYTEGRSNNITFIYTLDGLSDIPLNDSELTTLLSNLMDNAVEACSKCPPEDRLIRVGFSNGDDDLIISVSNIYDGRVNEADGELRTTKEDEPGHGYGLDNIKAVVSSHGGVDSISYDGREFRHTVSIPRKAGSSLPDTADCP